MSEKVAQKRLIKRQTMLSGFIKVFSSFGLDGTNIGKLAASVDAPESLLYKYFENKDDIIRQCVAFYHEQVLRELGNIFVECIHQPDEMAERVLAYLDSTIDICRFLVHVMAHPIYCAVIADTKKLAQEYVSHATKLFQEEIGADAETAMSAALILHSVVDEYILNRSRVSFLAQFNAVVKMVLR